MEEEKGWRRSYDALKGGREEEEEAAGIKGWREKIDEMEKGGEDEVGEV